MAAQLDPPDVAVAGGGTIGLAIAWRALQRGLRTVVLDAGEPGAWNVAAGMLAPVTEADFGEEALLRLGLEGAARFDGFCAELAAASGRDPGLHRSGTLVVARDGDEAERLDRLHALQRSLGLESGRLLPSGARRAEPALSPTVRLALDVPGDHSIEPRSLAAALAEAVEGAGGEIRPRARVERVIVEDGRAAGFLLA
ncbi:MAG: FAD-dependent oxidoreductase, partial [Actinomycetota bacterium]|nr:FAD-dependent oxidoreductase [Actinomycetota bacterium]